MAIRKTFTSSKFRIATEKEEGAATFQPQPAPPNYSSYPLEVQPEAELETVWLSSKPI
jgi:hypothetical protein